MKSKKILFLLVIISIIFSCNINQEEKSEFSHFSEQFSDLKVLRYQIPGFDKLTLNQKKFVYYLTEAGLYGRDIMYDQNYRHNLKIRRALENIYLNYNGNKNDNQWKSFEIYLKRIWFSNGIHHHYSNDKFDPDFSQEYLKNLMNETNTELNNQVFDLIFNDVDSKKVNRDKSKGIIIGSSVNFYDPDITEEEVENFYNNIKVPDPKKPISLGLNSKLVREDGVLKEKVWKKGGMYSESIEKIIENLEIAKKYAENKKQADALGLLIKYYETGDLKIWDDYNVAWVETTEGDVDYINGFIEVYNDPKGYRGSYESVVQIKDFEMSKKT